MPDWVTWDLVVRSLNITGCAISLAYLVAAARRQWRDWSFKTQDHWWALVGWVCLGMEGTIESILFGISGGPRTIIQTLVVAWTLRALTHKGKIEATAVTPFKKEDADDVE